MKQENPSFVTNNSLRVNGFSRSSYGTGARFLEYKLIERKSSVLTHKSEDSMLAEQKGKKMLGIIIIAATVVIGAVVMFFIFITIHHIILITHK